MTGLVHHGKKYVGRQIVWLILTPILNEETAGICTVEMEIRSDIA